MKHTLALTLALASTLAFAQAPSDDHSAHHPEGAAAAPAAAAPTAPTNPLPAARDNVSQQVRMMQDMHQRLQAAKTTAERQALMGEQMRLMQSGMEMMSRMGQGGGGTTMGGMGGMGGRPPGGTQGNPPQAGMGNMGGMMAMHGSMEQRIAMMEQMMQMMVDREAAMPRK
jgi:hypothetical protein